MVPTAMRTESKKTYSEGFALTESELRRLHDIQLHQMQKSGCGTVFQTRYELKYLNGCISYPTSLDEVLAQENFGSIALQRLRMDVFDKDDKESATVIAIQFDNSIGDEWDSESPIRFVVRGNDRDWVFITSSMIDERIRKVKLLDLRHLSRGPSLAIILAAFLSAILVGVAPPRPVSLKSLDALESAWRAGSIKDPVEVTLRAVRISLEARQFPIVVQRMLTGLVAIGGASLAFFHFLYGYFFPRYNFLWGDYLSLYKKRTSIGRFLLSGVLLAILLGLVVNFISNSMGF
jgi:hypothetical protein